MIKEHDPVILTSDVAEEGLVEGDVGTVIHVYAGGRAFEVEFMTLGGETVAVATVSASQVREVTGRDIVHARAVVAA